MQLKIDYTADQNHYDLSADFDAESERDAEALGYGAMVLFKAAEFIAKYSKATKPEIHDRIQRGISKAVQEMAINPNWPFDKTIITD